MITAKNYAAQAEKSLSEVFSSVCFPEDVDFIKDNFIDKIKDCVHFALPNGGTIFDDGKKGIKNERVRLPFKNMTVEYYSPKGEDGDTGSMWASKHLIFATEVNIEEAKEAEPERDFSEFADDDIWIFVYSACYIPHLEFWTTDVLGWAMPSSWDENINNDEKSTAVRINGFPLVLMPKELENAMETHGKSVAMDHALKDISSEVSSLLELCEALSCSNVKHEIMEKIDPAVNQRRVSAGKVPMYETRTLWIDVPGESKTSGESKGGTHRSPRQHLRRGHIRKLHTGKKVWVNAAVVGAKENGFIKKDYAIKEAA